MFMSKLTARRENKVDLKNKTYRELCELLERQDRILGDRRLVRSLPDNSEKVNNFRDKIQLELDNRRLYETLCKDMQLLDLDKNQLDALECTGKLHIPDVKNECSRSDIDDNGDVLKMFATHSGLHKDKIYIKEKSEKPLIKNENCFNNVELYAKNLCGRIDTHSTTDRCLLLLNKPIKPNVHSEIKAKNLSLKESVILQILHENKIKDMQVERSVQRSFDKFKTANYRDVKPVIEDMSDEDDDTVLNVDNIPLNDEEY